MNRLKGLLIILLLFTTSLVAAAPININTANAEEIAKALYGVGPHKAQAIVAYREKHGLFKSVQAVKKVKGMGQGIIDGNKGDIRIE
ncbi:MAG: helix-hairpin-helix domain-containing protein [Gammaproteobacteria bacterium]